MRFLHQLIRAPLPQRLGEVGKSKMQLQATSRSPCILRTVEAQHFKLMLRHMLLRLLDLRAEAGARSRWKRVKKADFVSEPLLQIQRKLMLCETILLLSMSASRQKSMERSQHNRLLQRPLQCKATRRSHFRLPLRTLNRCRTACPHRQEQAGTASPILSTHHNTRSSSRKCNRIILKLKMEKISMRRAECREWELENPGILCLAVSQVVLKEETPEIMAEKVHMENRYSSRSSNRGWECSSGSRLHC
mmetsp:Transcript_32673/g.68314  ORF Transcript_32673/g.68314 Transcript_32673/m.68314 type:complete len:248 (-) Transcript_32673:865-1608(-)